MKLPPGYVPGQGLAKATGYGGFGQKLMEKMGWEKGRGLGKNEHGITEAIDVKKKEDTAGVGANAGWDWSANHWEAAYNSAVQVVDQLSTSGSETDDSSDADAAPAAGARHARVHRDGTLSTASAAELRIAKDLAKDPWGRFRGREGKMERIRRQEAEHAAMAAQKLGMQLPSPQQETNTPTDACPSSSTSTETTVNVLAAGKRSATKKRRRSAAADDDSDGADSDPAAAAAAAAREQGPSTSKSARGVSGTGRKGKAGKGAATAEAGGEEGGAKVGGKGSGKKGKGTAAEEAGGEEAGGKVGGKGSGKKGKRSRHADNTDAAPPVAAWVGTSTSAAFTPTPATGWWGATYFRSAGLLGGFGMTSFGLMGGMGEDDAVHKRRTFDEGDQEALYMDTHNKQRQGRRGLGKSTTINIGGVKLPSGQLAGANVTKFDEEDAGEAEAGAKPSSSGRAPAGTATAKSPKHRWVKLAKPILKKAPKRRMKLKALWKVLKAQLREGPQATDCDWSTARDSFLTKVQSSSKMAVQGKYVEWMTNEQ